MKPSSPSSPLRAYVLIAVPVLLAVLVGLRVALEVAFADRIYPGVQAAGLDLGGQPVEQAAKELQAKLDDYGGQPVTIVGGDQTFNLTARDLGFRPDGYALALAAYQAGRTGDLMSHLGGPLIARDLALPLPENTLVDDQALAAGVANLATRIDRPAVDASLVLQPSIQLTPSHAGQKLDQSQAIALARAKLTQFQANQIDLPVATLQPSVTTEQLAPLQARAQQILGKPVSFVDGQQSWPIDSSVVASALILDKDPYVVDVSQDPFSNEVAAIAGQVDQPAVDAQWSIANGKVTVSSDVAGRAVDQAATLAATRQALLAGSATVDVVEQPVNPKVTKDMLASIASDAQKTMDQGIMLTAEGQQFQLGPSDMADLLKINRAADGATSFSLDPTKLAAKIAQIDQGFQHPSQDARFGWNNGQVTLLQSNVPAVGIDEPAAVQAVLGNWQDGPVDLPLTTTTMQVDDTYLARLSGDLKGVIQERDTSFAGSIPERAHNITLALSRINGTLVAPGQMFSFNKAVGPTTLATGFQWGFGYTTDGKGASLVVPSVAGGICQVATTLFQPVFWAGYEIDQRNWHMFPMHNYADKGYIGLDATVSPDDNLDFQFTNDTDHALLIVAGVNGTQAEIQLIGTQPDWTVKVDPEKVTNIKPAPSQADVSQSPLFAKGRQITLEVAQQGLTSHVVRHVVYPDGHERTLTMTSTYLPSPLSILVGTG